MFLVHLQDAHIKPQTWASIPAVKDDAYHALDEMLLALAGMGHDTRDAYLIISGDLFDSTRIHASDLEAVTRLCQNFKRTYYIIGTHDYTEPPFLSSMENTVWLRDEEITDLGEGVRLAGIQYNRSRPYLLECLKKLRKQGFGATCGLRDVLVLHQGFQHLLGFEGAYQLTLADLVEHVPEARVLCGHVHIPDYTLFMACKRHFGMKAWSEWPDEGIRMRTPEAVERYKWELREDIELFTYIQYLFFLQWEKLRKYLKEKGISVIGDVPIYVAMDSADTWSEKQFFEMNEQGIPDSVSGVPPDYFTADGQLWGNPLYRWDKMEADGFGWWIRRIGGASRLFDVIRIDHLR